MISDYIDKAYCSSQNAINATCNGFNHIMLGYFHTYPKSFVSSGVVIGGGLFTGILGVKMAANADSLKKKIVWGTVAAVGVTVAATEAISQLFFMHALGSLAMNDDEQWKQYRENCYDYGYVSGNDGFQHLFRDIGKDGRSCKLID